MQQTGVDPSRLQLELKESIAATNPKLAVTVLAHLKHMGIGVVLDDFGTGSMPMVGLAQFPVDALNIARSLVQEMQSDRGAVGVVELIITLAHKMNLKLVAEGIETPRQLERLLELDWSRGRRSCSCGNRWQGRDRAGRERVRP